MCKKITIKVEGTPEEIAEMLKIDDYKRAINDIKISLNDIDFDCENVLVLCQEIEYFIKEELPQILEGLELDN